MNKANTIVASVATLSVILFALSGSAQARAHRHSHHYAGGYALYYDYSHGNAQSPTTYVYPAANWGPFFHRVRHYGPVVPYAPPAS
jgi:hypothetical protein